MQIVLLILAGIELIQITCQQAAYHKYSKIQTYNKPSSVSCVFFFDDYYSFSVGASNWDETFLYCLRNQISLNSTQWSQCVNTCCNEMPIDGEAVSYLNECDQYSANMDDLLPIEIAIPILIFLAIIIVWCFCCNPDSKFRILCLDCDWRKKTKKDQMKQSGKQTEIIKQMILPYNADLTLKNMNETLFIDSNDKKHRKWSEFELFEAELCSICLSQSPNLKTSCSHSFHIICILNWLAKKKNCPNCNNCQLTHFQVYCKCLRAKKLISTIEKNTYYVCQLCNNLDN